MLIPSELGIFLEGLGVEICRSLNLWKVDVQFTEEKQQFFLKGKGDGSSVIDLQTIHKEKPILQVKRGDLLTDENR